MEIGSLKSEGRCNGGTHRKGCFCSGGASEGGAACSAAAEPSCPGGDPTEQALVSPVRQRARHQFDLC